MLLQSRETQKGSGRWEFWCPCWDKKCGLGPTTGSNRKWDHGLVVPLLAAGGLSPPPARQSGRGVYFCPDRGCKASRDKSEVQTWSSGKCVPNLYYPLVQAFQVKNAGTKWSSPDGMPLAPVPWAWLSEQVRLQRHEQHLLKMLLEVPPMKAVDHPGKQFTARKSPRSTWKRIGAWRNWDDRMAFWKKSMKKWQDKR